MLYFELIVSKNHSREGLIELSSVKCHHRWHIQEFALEFNLLVLKQLGIDLFKHFQDILSLHKVFAPEQTDMESLWLEPSTLVIVYYSHGFEFLRNQNFMFQ